MSLSATAWSWRPNGPTAASIFKDAASRCAAYGARLVIKDGVGIIRPE